MKKKFFSYLLTAAMLFTQISVFAEGETTEDTTTETEVTTISVNISPDNYASIYLQKGAAKTEAGGYNGTTRNLYMYYNDMFADNANIYMHSGTILSEYTVPLKDVVSKMDITHYVSAFPSNAKNNGSHPIFYNIGAFSEGLNIATGCYVGPTTYGGTDGKEEYEAIKAITTNYWPVSATTSVGYTKTNWASQVAATFKGSSETTGSRTKGVAAAALTALQNDDGNVITFATGRSTSGYAKAAYSLNAAEKIPYLTATYEKTALVEYINSATEEGMHEIISGLGTIGVIDGSKYSSLIAVAKEYVEGKLYETASNGGFADLEAVCAAYDEHIAFAAENGSLIAINGVKSEVEMKDMIKELGVAGSLNDTEYGYAGFTSLVNAMADYVVSELYEIVVNGGFESVDAFYTAYDEQIAYAKGETAEDPVTVEISPENYASIHISDEGYHGYSRAEEVFYNTPYTTNAKLYAESGSVITSYEVPLKEYLSSMEINYSINTAGQMSNGHIPVFYDINKFDIDVPAGKYAMVTPEPTITPEPGTEEVVTASEITDDGLDDEEEGGDIVDIPTEEEKPEVVAKDVYAEVLAYANNYWPASGYSYSGTPFSAKVAFKTSSTSTGRIAHDVTSTAMKALVDDKITNHITFAMGRETSGYMNFSVNVSNDASIPTLTLTYEAGKVANYINATESADDVTELLATLDKAGILTLSDYGYAGYTGVGEKYKAQINESVYEKIANGGYFKVADFIAAYDEAVLFVANNVINNPDTYISFDDQTANDVSGNENNATITGDVKFVTGANGTKALRIENEFGKTAQQYLNMGAYDFSESSFSIVFWMKAPGRGVRYEETGDSITAGTPVDFSSYTGKSGGVVLSNKDFSVNANTGFAFAAMPVYTDFSFNMKLGENAVSNTVGIQTAIDSRWHQISYVVNRAGKASFYVDNTLTKEVDISKQNGSLGCDNLIFGADGLGQYGMNKGEFDEIKIYSSALEASKIEELYYKTALDKLNNDVEVLLEGENASLYSEENITALEEKLAESKAFVADYKVGNLADMVEQYNEFDEYFNLFLNKDVKGVAAWGSDVHISEPSESHLNAQNLKRFLTESKDWENPAKSFVLSGDLADVGADDLRYFFGFLDKWVVDGSNMAICRGNHDEPVGSEKDTGISYTRAELKDKYVAWMDKYVNNYLALNKDVTNSEGNLAQPFYYSTDGAAHYISVDIYWPTSKSISDTQLIWLKKVLDTVSGDGKPIFFIQHNPLYGTQPRVESDKNQLSKAADTKIKNLVKDYDNIFILTGHHHESFATGDGNPFKVKLDDGTETGVWLLNTTVLCSKNISRGYEWAGGYYINIYDDKVVFRARDFENQKWLRDYDLTFELKDATRNVMGDVRLFDTADGTEYTDVASAAGKTVKVQVPVGMVKSEKEYSSIFAVYSLEKLLTTELGNVSSDEMYVTFEMTIPEGAASAKVMVWENMSTIKPVCEFAVKN